MAESQNNGNYSSPMDEVFAWATPHSINQRKEQFIKRKCDDDSGYASPFSSDKSKSNNLGTPYRSSDMGFSSAESDTVYTPYMSSSMDGVKKRILNTNLTANEDKLSMCTHNYSIPSANTYSDFLFDASLYNEQMETNTDLSLGMITEEKEQDSLGTTEICKDIEVNLSMNTEQFITPPIANTSVFPRTPTKLLLTPTKLSSSQRRKTASAKSLLRRRNRSLLGFEKIDILFQLGGKANYSLVIEKILGYLSAEDLSNMTMVSKTWKNVCLSDPKANERWLDYVQDRKERKENLISGSVLCKLNRQTPMPILMSMNHSTPLQMRQPLSPPVSPSKVRFHMFQKEARKLKDGETLMQCPRCRHPSACSPTDSLGVCCSNFCRMRFCTVCKGDEHISGNCPRLTPNVPTTPTKRGASIGSKQSRRNLRRL